MKMKIKDKIKHSDKDEHVAKFKTPKRFRLIFYNENTLSLVWSIRMGRTRVVLSLAAIFLAVICVGAMLISFTPLRTLLPGYLHNSERREYIAAESRVDSILHVMQVNDLYLNNINKILLGEVRADSLPSLEEALISDSTLIMPTTAEEREFVRSYREREGFTLSDGEKISPEIPVFVRPIRDAEPERVESTGGIRFMLGDKDADVYSTARGVIVDIYGTPEGGYTVLLQHPNGYLSRYEGLSNVYFDRGQSIGSGSRLGKYKSANQHPFDYSLMRDGAPLDPMEYIAF